MSRAMERTDCTLPWASNSGTSRQLNVDRSAVPSNENSVSCGAAPSNTRRITSSQKSQSRCGKPSSRCVRPMNCSGGIPLTASTLSETNRCRPSRSKRMTTSGMACTSVGCSASLARRASSACLRSVITSKMATKWSSPVPYDRDRIDHRNASTNVRFGTSRSLATRPDLQEPRIGLAVQVDCAAPICGRCPSASSACLRS